MPDFTLRQLECFVAVADHATIAHAAGALHSSPSAVNTAVTELEKHLGEALLIRRRAHGVTLTTAGRALLPQARALLAAARDLAPVSDGQVRGHFMLGIYSTLSASLLPAILDGFGRAHPRVEVDFTEGSGDELLTALDDGRVDAAILYDRDITGLPHTRALYQVRAHVLLPADHRLAGAERVSLRELADDPFIQFDVAPAWQNTSALMAAAGVSPRVEYVTGNYELARSLVGRGLGYSVLVNRPASDTSHEGRKLVVRELDPAPEPVAVVIAWPRGRAVSRPLQAFLDWAPGQVLGPG
ncbi:MAG TPA: LysR family transcriptional regulator [Gordonia polyisoprenivorans]|uniref:LysR family transcriptional regulator n=1 Tax=Gordonia polyisoprenivorans TaxID=84595 RepID=UPI000B99D831|nr:LysR family transcriptional regulator [Gordonia polyisoprenivorans]MBE7193743.1 LysR family transcriptional regulator [Gordonia polyisoprenivorans]OZC33211.1 LysR family transcriptional regulator [Gordonia polyisoprenivorans]HCS58828.1 LysR family transcriptional regulator [Gordonia polyisoprenivorans]